MKPVAAFDLEYHMARLTLWPHQERGRQAVHDAIAAGEKRICLTCPTGGGKTALSVHLIENLATTADVLIDTLSGFVDDFAPEKKRIVFYTHRKMLLKQTGRTFEKDGIKFGVRASGYKPNLDAPVQLSSIRTEAARVLKRKYWGVHAADYIFIDEVHANADRTMEDLIAEHVRANPNVVVIGLTATPIDMWNICTSIVYAGKNSELRATVPPAHVWCKHYCPDEPDLRNMPRTPVGEFVEGDLVKRLKVPTVFGRVYPHHIQYNPDLRPAILFAPSVAASKFFVDEYKKKGIKAAHIDGECIYWGDHDKDGNQVVQYTTKAEDRDAVRDALACGDIKVVSNRWVLLDGVDWPFVYHGIFATSFGSLQGWLQAGGRLLRGHPTLDHVICQDHGGNARRHGWLNADREWHVGDSWKTFQKPEADDPDYKKPKEEDNSDPIVCPRCNAFRTHGPVCGECGYQSTRSKIKVLETDGTLRPYEEVYVPKKINTRPAVLKEWEHYLYACYHSRNPKGTSFNQAVNQFSHKHPEFHIHENYDSQGRKRWASLANGLHFLPLPDNGNPHKLSLKVKDLSKSDFYKLTKSEPQ